MAVVAQDDNIVLIGMPGVGKSTIGVLLAKAVSRGFLDTDVHIQSREGRRLQDIIDTDGLEAFLAVEERAVLSITCRSHVIATGGSVVYSDQAMRHLKTSGIIVYLDLPLPALEARVLNLDSRGVVMAPGKTFAGLYEERRPLYERHADIAIDCANLNHEAVVGRVMEMVGLA